MSKTTVWRDWFKGSYAPSNHIEHRSGTRRQDVNLGINRPEFVRNAYSPPEQDSCLEMLEHVGFKAMQKEVDIATDSCASMLRPLQGKTIRITALNIDIVNSSQKIKVLSSENAGEYYQAFIENTSALIQDYGGYVLKNVGDSVLGFFPCSNHFVENHDKAVLCGLAMRDIITNSLNCYFMERKLPSIECRISADFGQAKVVRIRSNGGYSAIDLFGTSINSAAKISHHAKPNQMVIGDDLFSELIKTDLNNIDCKLVNRFSLRGNHDYAVYLVENMRQ